MKKRYICVVDLEATCTNKNEFPREEMEIIEIGATLVDLNEPSNIIKFKNPHFQVLIKPKIHPILTDFCTELTTITQEEIDELGVTFGNAMHRLGQWIAPYRNQMVWGSWGEYDKYQFLKDIKRNNVKHYPLKNIEHVNLSMEFRKAQSCGKKGLKKALKMAKLEFEGTQHRALPDAINTSRLIPYIFPLRCK